MTFLQKLKGEGVELDKDREEKEKKEEEENPLKGIAELKIDLFQTDSEIIVFALVAGTLMEDLKIAVEGDNDIITIQGTRRRPEEALKTRGKLPEGKYFTEEVEWGDFFRKIILPESIQIQHAKAQIHHGVLIVKLPIHSAKKKSKVELKIENLDNGKK